MQCDREIMKTTSVSESLPKHRSARYGNGTVPVCVYAKITPYRNPFLVSQMCRVVGLHINGKDQSLN